MEVESLALRLPTSYLALRIKWIIRLSKIDTRQQYGSDGIDLCLRRKCGKCNADSRTVVADIAMEVVAAGIVRLFAESHSSPK
jgi:hypothetical protein